MPGRTRLGAGGRPHEYAGMPRSRRRRAAAPNGSPSCSGRAHGQPGNAHRSTPGRRSRPREDGVRGWPPPPCSSRS